MSDEGPENGVECTVYIAKNSVWRLASGMMLVYSCCLRAGTPEHPVRLAASKYK